MDEDSQANRADPWAVPASWVWARMGDVAEVIGGGTPRTSDRDNFEGGDIPWVTPADLSGYEQKYIAHGARAITKKGLENSGAQVMPAGSVLFSSRAPIGYVAIAANPVSTNQGFKSFVLRDGISSDYVYYYLKRARDLATAMASGTTFLELSGAKAARLPIPIAPRAEQDRIIGEIETQLTRLDAAVAVLKRVWANLKRYRASVLKVAVEGRLAPTEAERARLEGRNYESREQLEQSPSRAYPTRSRRRAGRLWGAGVVPGLTDEERKRLPVGWVWVKVRELGADPDDTVQVGPMSMRSEDFCEAGVPVLNVGCVGWGTFNEKKLNFLPEAKAREFARYRVSPGDVLFTRSGTVGRSAVAKEHHAEWLMTFHLLRVRLDPHKCLPHFLQVVFEGAPHIRRQARGASVGTTRAGFNTNLLAMLDVPLPPLEEQHRIVEEVERRLSLVNQAAGVLNVSLGRAGRLRQAILQQAFEGGLVPQDPSDEPASVLLERIRKDTASERERRSGRGRRGTMGAAGVKGAAR